MAREYGLTVWTFGDISFEEKCRIAKEIGVDGIEVQGDLSQDSERVLATLKNYNLKVLSVTPDNMDISSTNEQVRTTAVNYFLDLISWAKEISAERICIHGEVGKTSGCGDLAKDWKLLVSSVSEIMKKAEELDMEVVYEVLNRYENYQIVTAQESLRLIDEVKYEKFYALLDSYHMNIEEADPVGAIKQAGLKLGVYHVADSNREAVGNGHIDIKAQIGALHEIGYNGPIIMEMVAAGPNPFTPVKDGNYLEEVIRYYKDSLEMLTKYDVVEVSL